MHGNTNVKKKQFNVGVCPLCTRHGLLDCHYTHNVHYFEVQISHGARRSNRLTSLVAIALTYNQRTQRSPKRLNVTALEAS